MELAVAGPVREKIARPLWRQVSGVAKLTKAIAHGYRIAYKGHALTNPGQPEHQKLVSEFCQELCKALDINLNFYGEIPKEPALWVSNHISWTDITILGSLVPAFFLAKAEIKKWPILGHLAEVGGTLFIRRGSGDSGSMKNQLVELLKKNVSVIIFPEATTTNGRYIKKIHGRLLVAAGEAGRKVQPVVIAYTGPDGKLDDYIPYIDDMTVINSLSQIFKAPKPVTAHLMVLPALEVKDKSPEQITSELQGVMEQGLRNLHEKILVRSTS